MGLQYNQSNKEIEKTGNNNQHNNWSSPKGGYNHNFQRINRYLQALDIVELTDERDAFLGYLEGYAKNYKDTHYNDSLENHWQKASDENQGYVQTAKDWGSQPVVVLPQSPVMGPLLKEVTSATSSTKPAPTDAPRTHAPVINGSVAAGSSSASSRKGREGVMARNRNAKSKGKNNRVKKARSKTPSKNGKPSRKRTLKRHKR